MAQTVAAHLKVSHRRPCMRRFGTEPTRSMFYGRVCLLHLRNSKMIHHSILPVPWQAGGGSFTGDSTYMFKKKLPIELLSPSACWLQCADQTGYTKYPKSTTIQRETEGDLVTGDSKRIKRPLQCMDAPIPSRAFCSRFWAAVFVEKHSISRSESLSKHAFRANVNFHIMPPEWKVWMVTLSLLSLFLSFLFFLLVVPLK